MHQSNDTHIGLHPSLAELIALRERVRGWPPANRGSRGISGLATSPLRGRGMEYAESRPYAPGDDARHIDWRVTARTGRAHTKVFHTERERVTLLACDTAQALYFGTRVCFKSVQAARVGALTAWGAQRSGDRIAALRGSRNEAPVAPAGGARGALRVLDALTRWYTAAPADDAGLDEALRAAARLLRPGSRVVVLFDAPSLEAVHDDRLSALTAHHDVIAVPLSDPLELDPPRARLPFSLAAAGERHELDLHDGGQRREWDARFATPLDGAVQRLKRLGARTLPLRTDMAPDAVLAALLPHRREAA